MATFKMVAYFKKKAPSSLATADNCTQALFYIHKDKLGNKNLHFAQSVTRKFWVVATTNKTLVGPV